MRFVKCVKARMNKCLSEAPTLVLCAVVASILVVAFIYKTRTVDSSLWKAFIESQIYHKIRLTHSDSRDGSDRSRGSSNNKSRILCWIPTGPLFLDQVENIRATWGRRCDTLLFVSSKEDKRRGIIQLPNVYEGREFLWRKTMEALIYIYKNYYPEVEWILKADGDTYVIVENLRQFLSNYSWEKPLFLGERYNGTYKNTNKSSYNSGGAGYVLSRAALKKLITDAVNNSNCHTPPYISLNTNGTFISKIKARLGNAGEDVELAQCFRAIGILPEDTRDEHNRLRFTQEKPQDVLSPAPASHRLLKARSFYSIQSDEDLVSERVISFHQVKPAPLMHVLEFLIYKMKPIQKSRRRRDDQLFNFYTNVLTKEHVTIK